MATSSSSSKPTLPPHHSPHHFTPIEEGNEDEELSQGRFSFRATSPSENATDKRLHLTPTHQNSTYAKGKRSSKKKQENGEELPGDDDGRGILCNKCRPSGKDKMGVVPMDNNGVDRQSLVSPNGIFKSLFSSLVKKSPKSSCHDHYDHDMQSVEEQWKIAAAELSKELVQATRKRDEAVLEASRLKYAMAELEKKLNKLEIYCQNLESGLELCNDNKSQFQYLNYHLVKIPDQSKVIEHFLVSVSEARSSVRLLSRALTLHLKKYDGGKVNNRLCLLLQPHDIKISLSRNPRELLVFVEALLNNAFYEDFESSGFQKSGPTQILNPIDRCEANFSSFKGLQGLTWGDVLTKGTRHFSEDFSKFCDRKMSEIVGMLGWNRAWPEQLLQSFFGASKAVWLVHLLAHSLHPSLPIFRVDKGAAFDSVYMEDMGADKARKLVVLVPSTVRIMTTPGFFVYDNVVKCKVICRYHNSSDGNGQLLTPSPV